MEVMHKQVLVKVNAQVDERIVPLVLALSRFPQVRTFSSCQKSPKDGLANVIFTLANQDPVAAVDFLELLSLQIREAEGDTIYACFSLEWFAGGSEPSCWLRVPPADIERLAGILNQLADGFPSRAQV